MLSSFMRACFCRFEKRNLALQNKRQKKACQRHEGEDKTMNEEEQKQGKAKEQAENLMPHGATFP